MTSNTHHRVAGFFSSQEMASSEIQKRATSLGKALVQELGLEPGVDMLARWMAHYIAEQIAIAENSAGDDKNEAEKRCFETILELWQHRSSLPNGRRPFENFESIFRALERLDPENSAPYYYSKPIFSSPEPGDSDRDLDEVQQWLVVAQAIDRAARVCLEYVFYQAALNAVDEKTATWLENALASPVDGDIPIIVRLVYAEREVDSETPVELEQKAKQDRLMAKIKQLGVLVTVAKGLRDMYAAEIEALSQSDPPKEPADE